MIRPLRTLLILAALAASLQAAAQTIDNIHQRGSIRLGYSETKAPFSFKARDDDQPAGYSIEFCRRIAQAALLELGLSSLRVEWVSLDPPTRLDAVSSGRVDLECGTTTVTLERRRQVAFSLPIYVDAATLLGRDQVARNLRELNGRRVAVADATTTVLALRSAAARAGVTPEVVLAGTLADAFALLKEGKVDAIAGDRTSLVGTFLLGGGAEGLALFPEELSFEPYALALRRGDEDFRLLVDAAIAALYRSGEIDTIYTQWLAPFGAPSAALRAVYGLNALPER